MAILSEEYALRSDGVRLIRTYSDKGLIIKKDSTDEIYVEAIDIENSGYTYSETDESVELMKNSPKKI